MHIFITSASVINGNDSTDESRNATAKIPPPPITATKCCNQSGSFTVSYLKV